MGLYEEIFEFFQNHQNNIVYCGFATNCPARSLSAHIAIQLVANPTIYPLARSLCSLIGFLPVSLSLILLLGYASPFSKLVHFYIIKYVIIFC